MGFLRKIESGHRLAKYVYFVIELFVTKLFKIPQQSLK